MSKITNEELTMLAATNNELEWDAACDAIKDAHGGYPEDWWPKVKMSGLMDAIAAKWGKPDAFELKFITIDDEDFSSRKR